MWKEPFKRAIPILTELVDHGYEAYFVGGAVRDLLIGRDVNDVDIATSALPSEVKAIFPKTVDVGIEHGTILVLQDGIGYEVTTFRTEAAYEDFRRPSEVSFVRNLLEDLQRRDFTMNAIALSKDGEFIDPFKGQESIQQRIIQTVGHANERFQEDALRMMRAIRFQAQLGFQMDTACLEGLQTNAELLQHIAVERKFQEMDKLLSGEYLPKVWKMFLTLRISNFLPTISDEVQKAQKLTDFTLEGLSLLERWTLLFYAIGIEDPVPEWKKWKASRKRMSESKTLLSLFYYRTQNNWSDYDLYKYPLSLLASVERLQNSVGLASVSIDSLQKRIHELPLQHGQALACSGSDLLCWTEKKSGPWIKECLTTIEKKVIARELANEKEIIREWVQTQWVDQ